MISSHSSISRTLLVYLLLDISNCEEVVRFQSYEDPFAMSGNSTVGYELSSYELPVNGESLSLCNVIVTVN